MCIRDRGYLVAVPVPEGMLPLAASDGEMKFVSAGEPEHSIRINVKEIPPEYSFSETLGGVKGRGWRILHREYGTKEGRRTLEMKAVMGERWLRAVYVRDGDALIRMVEEPHRPAAVGTAFNGMLRGLRLMTKAGYE